MSIGARGEGIARKFLERKGFVFIAKNFKTPRWGEIDLIMRDGDTTVFVEVKTRGSGSRLFGGPLGAINRHKIGAIQRAAQYYLSSKERGKGAARIDAVAVIIKPESSPEIEHYTDITSSVAR